MNIQKPVSSALAPVNSTKHTQNWIYIEFSTSTNLVRIQQQQQNNARRRHNDMIGPEMRTVDRERSTN